MTIQKQILELPQSRQAEWGMAMPVITHDLGVVAQMARHVALMYAGRIVEAGPAELIPGRPQHEYTQALPAAVPKLARAV